MSKLEVREIGPISGETEVRLADGATAVGFGGGGLSSVQTFTSSGTWTKPDGISKVMVEVVGAGGGGGGLTGTYATGGGGGGGYARKLIDVSSISSSTITVGSGGSGGSAGITGSNGGSSSWNDLTNTITSTGGIGAEGVSTGTYKNGGVGGTSSDGDFNIEGSKGGDGLYNNGWGGQSFLSNITSRPNNTGPGLNGLSYGCGGTGCSGSTSSGGDGADGIVIVTEYA